MPYLRAMFFSYTMSAPFYWQVFSLLQNEPILEAPNSQAENVNPEKKESVVRQHHWVLYRREAYCILSNLISAVKLVMVICWLKRTDVLIRIVLVEEILWSTIQILKQSCVHNPILIKPSYITALRQRERERTHRFSRSLFILTVNRANYCPFISRHDANIGQKMNAGPWVVTRCVTDISPFSWSHSKQIKLK